MNPLIQTKTAILPLLIPPLLACFAAVLAAVLAVLPVLWHSTGALRMRTFHRVCHCYLLDLIF